MKNLKTKTFYPQFQESYKKYLKIQKTLYWQHFNFSNARKNTICNFYKTSSVELEVVKKSKIKNRFKFRFPNFLTAQKSLLFLPNKTKTTAFVDFRASIYHQAKLQSKNSKLPFFKKRENFLIKNKITVRDYLKTRHVLNYCLPPQKMQNQNTFRSQGLKIKPIPSWKKSVATIYYLLIAYKKTMRVKLNYYFNNSANLQFFLAISPFLAYFLQASIEKYEFKYQQNTFFNKSLPGLKKPIQEINWETYAYTKYSTKLNSSFITQVNSVDDSFFISLNSHWQFKQRQLSIARFESLPCKAPKNQGSPISITKWSFLPSRYFYQLLPENEKQGFNEILLGQPDTCTFVASELLSENQNLLSSGQRSYPWQSQMLEEKGRSYKNQIPCKDLLNTNSQEKEQEQEQSLKKMYLGFQTKFPKDSSEIRFWKNFKFRFSETKPNLTFFNEGENQGQRRALDQKSENDRKKFNNPIYQLSSQYKATGHFQSLKNYRFALKKQMTLNSEWQIFFNELDDIPTKLNSVFQHEAKGLTRKANQTLKSPLIFYFSEFDFASTHLSTFNSSTLSLRDKANAQITLPKQDNLIQDLDNGYTAINKFSFIDFRECFNRLESNYKESKLKTLSQGSKAGVKGYPQNLNSNINYFKDKLTLSSKQFDLKPNSTFVSGNESNFAWPQICSLTGKADYGKGARVKFTNKNFSFNSNLLKNKLFLLKKTNLIGMETIQFQSFTESDQTWIRLLTKIFNRPFFKKEPPLFLDRNLQYNIDFGFSQLGNLIKLNVLTPNLVNSTLAFEHPTNVEKINKNNFPETSSVFKNLENGESRRKVDLVDNKDGVNSFLTTDMVDNSLRGQPSSFEVLPKSVSLILQNAIREDLRSSLPSWIIEAKNETLLPCLAVDLPSGKAEEQIDDKFAIGRSHNSANNKELKIKISPYPFLLKLANSETFFLKQFQFDNITTTALFKKPDSILGLLKKSDIGLTQNFETKKTFGLKLNEGRKTKKNFSLIQRKVSGYLYPDNLRNTILTNTNFFNLNKPSKKLNPNSYTKRYEQGFTKIISLSLLNPSNSVETSHSSLIQVYQPLIQNSIDSYYNNSLNDSKNSKEKSFAEKQVESILNFYKLQRGVNSLNRIEPDQSFPAQKEFFFGVPTASPLYGISLKEYKEKFEIRKKDIQKNHLISPYENLLNFIIQSNSNLKQNSSSLQNFFGDAVTCRDDTSRENLLKLDRNLILNEITKGPTFSNIFFEKIIPFSPFKPSLKKENIQNIERATGLNSSFNSQKNEKTFHFKQRAIPYKIHFNYTKSRVLSNNLNELEKSLIRSTFSTNLYEPIGLNTWTLSSQLGFAFIVLKLASILYNEYREEMGYYINEFAVFFNEYEKNNFLDFLDFFNPKENFRVINKTNKKFSDLVGGRFLLTEFGEVILLLRNSRKSFSKIGISKPQTISFDKSSSLSKIFESIFLMDKQKAQKRILDFQDFFRKKFKFAWDAKLRHREVFFETPHFKLENFIPKGILLIGPPGTGKTLLVKALSGEASVPVIVESGKMLTTNMENNGAEKLKDLFKAAREMSPCILFLDEIDTIGQKRENVLSTLASGQKENQIPNPFNFIYLQNGLTDKLNSPISENFFDLNSDILNPLLKLQIAKNSTPKKNQELNDLKTQITNQKISSGKQKYQDLIMLTQLLCELDGLNKTLPSGKAGGQEIIVIGATNRPATLDSALTRPGRFGKVIYLDLPGKQKRFELLKFYSHAKKDSLFLFNQQLFELGSFIPTFSSFSSSEAGSNQSFSSRSSDLNVILGENFSKSEKFLKTAFSKMQNFVLPFASVNLSDPSFFVSTLSRSDKANAKSQKFYQGFVKTNKNLGVDENINWNYFANQTVGLSAAHLASAMNRSALKAIYIYLSQTPKDTNVFNPPFLLKRPIDEKNSRFKIENRLKKIGLKNEIKQISLNRNSDRTLHLIKMSKESKLRLIAQSGLCKNKILNQLNLFFKKDAEYKVTKQQPLHNFETIEYGIQTISTMNTSLQLKVTKGRKVNKKIIGQLVKDDFLLKRRFPSIIRGQKEKVKETFLNLPAALHLMQSFPHSLGTIVSRLPRKILTQLWFPSQNLPSGEMQSFSKKNKSSGKRTIFYQKHRRYLRTLAFLGGSLLPQSAKASEPITVNKRDLRSNFKKRESFQNTNLVSSTLSQLKILSRYVNRIIQNQSLGWVLLSNSTCLIQNSFFLFSLQKQKQKNLNSIYYNLLFLNKNCKIDNNESRTLLKWQNFNLLNQSSLFGDSLFINRSAYYLSGKALINAASRFEKPIDEPISLWAFTGSVQTRQKKSSDLSFEGAPQGKSSKRFLTKIQFENFLLSLITGKATETLMLSNQLGIQKKNESNIGITELKELGVLIKGMVEKHLFYSQKQLNHKQISINLLENGKQINQDDFLFLQELSTLFEIQNKTLTHFPRNPLRSYDQFKSVDQPWWQFKSINLLSSFNLKYGEWYRLFLSEEQQNFRNIEWIAPDTYFHNQLNNSHLILNKKNLLSQKVDKNNYFVNPAFVSKYIQFSKLNWNQLQLLESESVVSYFLFESFNKSCNLLDNNREVIDSLVYSLICHESLRDFEILNNYRRYFK